MRHDARVLASMGVNTVRLDVSAVANSDERLAAIRHAVAAARVGAPRRHPLGPRRHGAAGARVRDLPRRTLPQGPLASGCSPPSTRPATAPTADRNRCISWSAWRAEQRALVHAIRSAGMHSPILLSTPRRSGDLRLLAHYHLTDQGIIYGVHFHGGPRTKLSARQPQAPRQAVRRPAHAASSRSSSTTSAASARAAASTAPAGATTSPPTSPTGRSTAAATARSARPGRATAPTRCARATAAGSRRFGAIYASRFLALTYAVDHTDARPARPARRARERRQGPRRARVPAGSRRPRLPRHRRGHAAPTTTAPSRP